jgi:hypothetical protein
MSTLARIGRWLLPWWPAYLVTLRVIYTSFPAASPCPDTYYPFGPQLILPYAVSEECHWIWFTSHILFLVFFVGLLVLCFRGIARLIIITRIRLTKRSSEPPTAKKIST